MQTVDDKKSKHSQHQIDRATRATEVCAKIGCPSIKDHKLLVQNGLINNCPVTLEDIKIAEDVFGKNMNALKGKTVRKTPCQVETDCVKVPRNVMKVHKNVTLTADIFFVQGQPFFVTLSRNIKFNTVEDIPNKNATTLIKACDNVINLCSKRGFKVTNMLMDGEFSVLKNPLLERQVQLDLTSANEHAGDIERFVRVIEERVRALKSRLPHKKFPKRLAKAMVRHVCRWLNVFPTKNSIPNISPRTLITGVKLDCAKHCRVEVGSHVQVHEEPKPTNDTDQHRTTGAIASEANDNLQGGHKFLSLTTGKELDRRNFNISPIPSEAIARVHELAKNEQEFNFGD